MEALKGLGLVLQRGPSEALWDVLQFRHAVLGHLWAVVDASCMLPLWAFLGVVLGRFGTHWDPLGLSGAPSRPSLGILQAFGRLGALLRASWDPLGSLLGRS